jgi:hypothetical protein
VSVGLDEEVFLGDTVDGNMMETPFGAVLIAGEYDIVYRNINGGFFIPANRNAVIFNLDLQEDNLDLSLNVRNYEETGDILINGAPAPMSILEQGMLELRRTSPHGLVDHVELGSTNNQSYSTKHLGGTYDVHYFVVNALAIAPRNVHAIIEKSVFLIGIGHDIDIPATHYQGDFLVNGAPAPTSPVETGKIYFLDRETDTEVFVRDTHQESYGPFTFIPGTYDIIYRHTIGFAVVPRNDYGLVARDVTFPASPVITVTLDIDIPVTDATIDLTQNGAPIPGFFGNGTVLLKNDDESTSLNLGNSMDLPWNGRLISGDYSLEWIHQSGAGVPRNDNADLGSFSIIGGADSMTLNMETLGVMPVGQVNGAPFPMANTAHLFLFADSLGSTWFGETNGLWPNYTMLLGEYNTLYSYGAGDTIPQNQANTRNCVRVTFCIFCDNFENL